MGLFSFDPTQTLTAPPVEHLSPDGPTPGAVEGLGSEEEREQFTVFQLGRDEEGPALVGVQDIEPSLEGDEAQPDVLARMALLSFHPGGEEELGPDSGATLRVTIGKDPESRDRLFDTVFWSVAAGLRLFHPEADEPAEGKEFARDLDDAFSRRPIEIAGGLGMLHFEVVRHKEPPWWRRIFGFLQSGTGQALTSVLGFPAISTQAIGVVDELLGRIEEDDHEVIFKSHPLRLALTRDAQDHVTFGGTRVASGALSPGYCVMARATDSARLEEHDPIYDFSRGILVPRDLHSDVVNRGVENPLSSLPYGVFRLDMKSTKLDPTFNYR